MKICPVGAELLYEDRQTDMMKLTVSFHNFVNVPIKYSGTSLEVQMCNVSLSDEVIS